MSLMPQDFVVFDIATAQLIPERMELEQALPIGIATAGIRHADGSCSFYFGGEAAEPHHRMRRTDCLELLNELQGLAEANIPIVTWGGTGLDFLTLAGELEMFRPCAKVAYGHFDLSLQFLCESGFAIGLSAVLSAMRAQEPDTVPSIDLPGAWADGQFEDVFEATRQTMTGIAMIYERILHMHEVPWFTRSGEQRTWRTTEPKTVAHSIEECRQTRDTTFLERKIRWMLRSDDSRANV